VMLTLFGGSSFKVGKSPRTHVIVILFQTSAE
jgi:hypothetical protein